MPHRELSSPALSVILYYRYRIVAPSYQQQYSVSIIIIIIIGIILRVTIFASY
jgi:hypothetical protein